MKNETTVVTTKVPPSSTNITTNFTTSNSANVSANTARTSNNANEPNEIPPMRWDVIAIFVGSTLCALIGAPLYGYLSGGYSGAMWLAFFLFMFWNGLSITGGYHRLWSHKSYEAKLPVRFCFALGGALSVQNSIKVWCSNHRSHHRFTDDDNKDPYSAQKGFWFSHLGWMLRDYEAAETDFANVKDLSKDWLIEWQHDYYWALALTLNILLPLGIGALLGDAVGGLILLGLTRLFICHHTTFFINSLAHFWGKQPYSDANSARDSGLLALFTYGEGYHNYHHTFQWDYRNGIHWYQFDPTKWLIASLSLVKLTGNLKVVVPEKIEQRIATMQLKAANAKLSAVHTINSEKWLALIDAEYQQLMASLNEWSVCHQQWLELKKASILKRWEETELINKLKELESELNIQRRQWRKLTQQFA